MPAIKCPHCDYRNLGTGDVCANCGEPLDTTGGDDSGSDWYAEGRELARLPILPSQRALSNFQMAVEPYRIDRSLQTYQSQVLMPPIVAPPSKTMKAIDWDERLPWHLPRSMPKLRGTIIHIQSELQFPDYPNVLRALLDILAEFIWMGANQPLHREGERVQVTILRVRTSDGQIRDARLPGYLRGAHLSLGDAVSLWGWRRRGSLTIKCGYNHTSKAIITSNMMSMFMPALILLGIIGLIVLLILCWSYILAGWSSIFTSIKK